MNNSFLIKLWTSLSTPFFALFSKFPIPGKLLLESLFLFLCNLNCFSRKSYLISLLCAVRRQWLRVVVQHLEPCLVTLSYIPIPLLVEIKEPHIIALYFTDPLTISEYLTINVVLCLERICPKLIVTVQFVGFIPKIDFTR